MSAVSAAGESAGAAARTAAGMDRFDLPVFRGTFGRTDPDSAAVERIFRDRRALDPVRLSRQKASDRGALRLERVVLFLVLGNLSGPVGRTASVLRRQAESSRAGVQLAGG